MCATSLSQVDEITAEANLQVDLQAAILNVTAQENPCFATLPL